MFLSILETKSWFWQIDGCKPFFFSSLFHWHYTIKRARDLTWQWFFQFSHCCQAIFLYFLNTYYVCYSIYSGILELEMYLELYLTSFHTQYKNTRSLVNKFISGVYCSFGCQEESPGEGPSILYFQKASGVILSCNFGTDLFNLIIFSLRM